MTIWLIILIGQVVASRFPNRTAIDQGFCHLQRVKIQFFVDCNNKSTVAIGLAKNESDTSGNNILQCFWIKSWDTTVMCDLESNTTGSYNKSSDIFDLGFIFKHNIHGGHYLRITTDCYSSYVSLKPCVSGFIANVTFYNSSNINVTCQHQSANFSRHPFIIQSVEGNQYGSCFQHKWVGDTCKSIPDGIQCVLQYHPDEILQCTLFGAIFNLSSPISNIKPTSPEHSPTSQHKETTESVDSSTNLQSITWSSPDGSPSHDDKSTSMTSSETTENGRDISSTSEGSTDKQLEFSSKSCKQPCNQSIQYGLIYVIVALCFGIFLAIVLIIWVCRDR